jgi:hypothetical protein
MNTLLHPFAGKQRKAFGSDRYFRHCRARLFGSVSCPVRLTSGTCLELNLRRYICLRRVAWSPSLHCTKAVLLETLVPRAFRASRRLCLFVLTPELPHNTYERCMAWLAPRLISRLLDLEKHSNYLFFQPFQIACEQHVKESDLDMLH